MEELRKLKMKLTTFEITTKTLGYFRWKDSIHVTKKLLGMIKYQSSEDVDLFDIDIRKIDMPLHAKVFMYGVGKFYCGLDLLPPSDP